MTSQSVSENFVHRGQPSPRGSALRLRNKPKYIVIADRIRSAIESGIVQVDDLLPSQNDLMREYGVSVTTVRKCIGMLVETGWIRAERGRGLFARTPPPRHSQRHAASATAVGCLMIGSFPRSDRFCELLVSGAVSVLEPAGREIRFASLPVGETLIPRLRTFSEGLHGILLCGEIRDDILRCLKQSGTRAVVIGHSNEPLALLEEFHRVMYDAEMAGYLAAQALALQGHRRIAFAYIQEHDRTRDMRTGFHRACRDHGVACSEILAATGQAIADRVAGLEDVNGIALQGEPTAVELVGCLKERGISIPQDKTVIVITGLPAEDYPEVVLPRVEFNIRAWGAEAARLLISETNAVVHKRIPVRYKPAPPAQV